MSTLSANSSSHDLRLKSSYWLTVLLLAQHALALWLVMMMWHSGIILWAGSMVVLISSAYYLTFIAWRYAPRAVVRLVSTGDGWTIIRNNGQYHQAYLMGDSYQSRWAILMLFGSSKRYWPLPVLIAKDAVDPHSWRRLQAYLTYP